MRRDACDLGDLAVSVFGPRLAQGERPSIRGSAFGLLAAVQSFGNLAASAIAGLLWTVVSPGAAFAYLATWMLVAVAGLATFR